MKASAKKKASDARDARAVAVLVLAFGYKEGRDKVAAALEGALRKRGCSLVVASGPKSNNQEIHLVFSNVMEEWKEKGEWSKTYVVKLSDVRKKGRVVFDELKEKVLKDYTGWGI